MTTAEKTFQEITLSKITPSPFNPRTKFDGREFDELVASVAAQDVIQPILVRPIKKGFEIVAGERRYRAKCKIAEANGGLDHSVIPAIVRKLDDDAAFDLMTIENLQRKDLNPFEEAQGFLAYVNRRGKKSIPELADRIGMHPGYIRRRVAVMELPKKVLKLWQKGELYYGHLEQFIRLKKNPPLMGAMITETIQWDYSVERLKNRIANQEIYFEIAKFDTEAAGCPTCYNNSEKQLSLFNMDSSTNARCLKRECFAKHQKAYLVKNWKRTGAYRKHKTSGFKLEGEIDFYKWEGFYSGGPWKDCKNNCEHFISILNMAGQIYQGKVCTDKECLAKKLKAAKKKGSGGGSETKDGPRVSWHGEYFREKFFQTRLPEKFVEIKADEEKTTRLALYSLLKSNSDCCSWFISEFDVPNKRSQKYYDEDQIHWYADDKDLFDFLTTLDQPELLEVLKAATIQVTLQRDFMTDSRHLVAEHIGIDLEKEWLIDEEYLHKKTKAEILDIGEKFGVFEQKDAQTYLHEKLLKKRGKYKGCKKSELVEIFLQSGVDLSGVVPSEILPTPKPTQIEKGDE